VIGVDTDVASIEYGRRLLEAEGHDPDRLLSIDATPPGRFDAIVLSEVLEHVPDEGISQLLETAYGALASGGLLLVTVPNGYGLFEMESFLWHRAGVGWLVQKTPLERLIRTLKRSLGAEGGDYEHPSTFDSSPHIQRFTLSSITRLLERFGFTVTERTGTVLVCGPITNILFTGVRWVTRLNLLLGSALPPIAAGFMVCAYRSTEGRR
jgi:SAM-dependent methyltransferase